MEASKCASCTEPFDAKEKGFKRHGLFTKFKGGSNAAESLESSFEVTVTPNKIAYLCTRCQQTLRTVHVTQDKFEEAEQKFRKIRKPGSYIASKIDVTPSRRSKSKRIRVLGHGLGHKKQASPLSSPKKIREKIDISVNNTPVGRAIWKLSQSKYKPGFHKLLKHSKVAKRSVTKILSEFIRKEAVNLGKLKSNTGLLQTVQSFSWDQVLASARQHCPTLTEFLTSAFTKQKHHCSLSQKRGTKMVSLAPVLGSVLSIVAFTRNNRSSTLQSLVSLMLWLGGCQRKVFKHLNRLGWCRSIDSTRGDVDRVRQDFDKKVIEWRDSLTNQEQFADTEDILDEDVLENLEDLWEDQEVTESIGEDDSSALSSEESNDTETESLDGKTTTHSVSSTDQYSEGDNSMVISTSDSSSVGSVAEPLARRKMYFDITFDNVNQKIGVRHHIRGKKNAMLNMVQSYATLGRIGSYGLSNEMPTAEEIQNITVASILPNDDDEVSLKNELTIIVSRILTTYIPAFKDLGVIWSIPHEHSSESSAKSHIVPLGVINKDETKTDEMADILESYNKYVQEDVNGNPLPLVLFCDGLSCERVAGAQRSRLNGKFQRQRLDLYEPGIQEWHRRLMFIQDTYDELFKYESHRDKGTLYHIKQYFDHQAVSKNIMDCFDKAEELLEFATDGYAVLKAMSLMGMDILENTPNNYPENKEEQRKYRDKVAATIVESIYEKPNISEVINVVVSAKAAKSSNCLCKLDIGGTMIFCCNRECQYGTWFHIECISMEHDDIPEGDWFCSEECVVNQTKATKKPCKKKTVDKFRDMKKEYCERLLWRGLNMMARHDAVKENDGPRMIRHWRFDMFEFHEKNHPKYFIFGHRLLANMSGATSERLKHNLLWERTVNVHGGQGKNIPKDLHNEHLNKEYKHNCRVSSGQLTEATKDRHSQMIGIGKCLDKVFEEQLVGGAKPKRKAGKVDRRNDLRRMVKLLQPLLLFNHRPGRAFAGFQDLKICKGTRFPKIMKQRILTHLNKMAKIKKLTINE